MFKSIYWKRRTSKRIMTNQLPDWYRQPDTMRFATVDHGTNRLTTSHPYRLQIADRWPPPTSTVALHGVNDDFFHAENLLSFYILSRPSENQHADTSIYVVVVDWGLTTSIATSMDVVWYCKLETLTTNVKNSQLKASWKQLLEAVHTIRYGYSFQVFVSTHINTLLCLENCSHVVGFTLAVVSLCVFATRYQLFFRVVIYCRVQLIVKISRFTIVVRFLHLAYSLFLL